jgi:formylglycine-generating enzyme required for sulfatase activity
MTTLANLTSLRSQRAGRLRAHLERLASGAAWVSAPWLRPADHTPDTVYVEPDVLLWNRAKPSRTADEELHVAISPVSDGRVRVRWADLSTELRRAVILGRPGEGKTTLLQRTCRRIAESSLALLDRRKPLDEIPIPLWLRAEDIVRAGSVTAALGIDSLEMSPSFALSREERGLALASPSAWLFVDALDECPDGTQGAATAAFATLGAVRARVLLSVRTYAWREADLPFVTAAEPAWSDGCPPHSGIEQDGEPHLDKSRSEDTVDVYELAPLTREQRIEMVTRWCARHPDRRDQLTRLLDEAPLRELSSNALLLTLLCAAATGDQSRVISRETRRVELYAWLVADLVTRPDKVSLDPASSAAQDRVLALARTAWALWQGDSGGRFHYQDWIDQLRLSCETRMLPSGAFREIQVDVERAGVLVNDGPLRRFFPQTAFEYLAGAGLVQDAALASDMPIRIARTIADHVEETRWREVIKLAIGHLAVIRRRLDVCSEVIQEVLNATKGSSGATEILLGEALVEAGDRDPAVVALLDGLPLGDSKGAEARRSARILSARIQDRLIAALLATMRADNVAAPIRARSAAALAWLGDPRFDAAALWLPVATPQDSMRGFLFVPSGSVAIGKTDTDLEGLNGDQPQHTVRIRHPFFIARWPVTVAQFAAYLRAVGQPSHDGDGLSLPSAPVCAVSAYEAEGYCRWLTDELARADGPLAGLGQTMADRLGVAQAIVRLPYEEEWEYVAKGGEEGRVYPWGSVFDANNANCEATGIRGVTAVGCFGGGIARWGAEELSGNVWEWTASGSRSLRVIRGGASTCAAASVRSASRDDYYQVARFRSVGFRVIVSPRARARVMFDT